MLPKMKPLRYHYQDALKDCRGYYLVVPASAGLSQLGEVLNQ